MKNSPTGSDLDTTKKSSATSEAADKARRVASAAASSARAKANDMSGRIEGMAEETVDNVLAAAHERVDHAQGTVENYVRTFGRAFDAAADSLQRDGMTMASTYVRAASSGLSQAADEVDGVDTSAITGNVERYVRGNPMLTVGGLALAGFVLSSVLRGGNRR